MSMRVIGGASVKAGLDRITKSFPEVKRAVDNSAEMIQGDASILAPIGPTGRLKISIDEDVERETDNYYAVKIGPSDDLESGIPGKPYPILVEFGGARGAAQPFLRPAFDANKRSVKEDIKDAVKRSL